MPKIKKNICTLVKVYVWKIAYVVFISKTNNPTEIKDLQSFSVTLDGLCLIVAFRSKQFGLSLCQNLRRIVQWTIVKFNSLCYISHVFDGIISCRVVLIKICIEVNLTYCNRLDFFTPPTILAYRSFSLSPLKMLCRFFLYKHSCFQSCNTFILTYMARGCFVVRVDPEESFKLNIQCPVSFLITILHILYSSFFLVAEGLYRNALELLYLVFINF